MNLKVGDKFFTIGGEEFEISHVTAHYYKYKYWNPTSKIWVQNMYVQEIYKLARDIKEKEIFEDTPTNRILYGKSR